MFKEWFRKDPFATKSYLWDSEGSFDYVLANPPFAGFEKDETNLDKIETANENGEQRSLNRTLPFLEAIVASLKMKGKTALVIPTSILNAEDESFVRFRELLLKKAEVRAIVGLPEKAFVHTDCGVHGVLLFLERVEKPRKDYEIFVDWAERLGYDRLGKDTQENDFPLIAKKYLAGDWPKKNTIRKKELETYGRWDAAWLKVVKDLPQNDADKFLKLSDIVEVRQAKWSRKQIKNDESYNYFEVGDADLFTGEVHAVQKISGFELQKKGRVRVMVSTGDILLPNHRDSLMAKSAPNGRAVVYVDEALDGTLTTDRFMILRTKYSKEVVCALLNSSDVRRQMVARCRGAASLDIRESILSEILIPKAALTGKKSANLEKHSLEIKRLRKALKETELELERAISSAFAQ
jgi:type I restriction-modification system DNA methylase subunit